MTIKTLVELPEKPHGVVFWWSNILRGYQLRVYLEGSALQPEIRLTRDEAESAARSLAVQHGFNAANDVYEIDIPRIETPIDEPIKNGLNH